MAAAAIIVLIIGTLLLITVVAVAYRMCSRRYWHSRHSSVLREWYHHTCCSLDSVLLYPALNMRDQPRTAQFHHAAAKALQCYDRHGYHEAVRNLEYTYDLAVSKAHHLGPLALADQEYDEHRYAVDLRITSQDPDLPEAVRDTALRTALSVLVDMGHLAGTSAQRIYDMEYSTGAVGGADAVNGAPTGIPVPAVVGVPETGRARAAATGITRAVDTVPAQAASPAQVASPAQTASPVPTGIPAQAASAMPAAQPHEPTPEPTRAPARPRRFGALEPAVRGRGVVSHTRVRARDVASGTRGRAREVASAIANTGSIRIVASNG